MKTLKMTLSSHTSWVNALKTLSNGDIASASNDFTIRIWNTGSD